MKAKLLFLFLFAGLLSGCTKNKFDTKPQIKIKSVKVGNITDQFGTTGAAIEIELTVTDKEGDAKGTIAIDKVDTARVPCPANTLLQDIYQIPDFPTETNQEVTFKVRYSTITLIGYGLMSGPRCQPRADTSYFRFTITDKAGNVSDPVRTDPIAIPN